MIENGVVEVERSKSTSKIDLNARRVGGNDCSTLNWM